MKNNYKELSIICLCFIVFGYGIFNNKEMCLSVSEGFYMWSNKVFPSLFPSVLITNILLQYNYYFINVFKYIGIKWYIFIFSLISGSINNALIIKDLYIKNIIDLDSANKSLMYSFFNSPIFLISMLSLSFDYRYILLIMISTYISNLIICIACKVKYKKTYKNNYNNNLSLLINNTISILFNILGIICFFILVSSIIINIFNLDELGKLIIKGLLEVTQGLTYLSHINFIDYIKGIITLLFINFGGLSIHLQVKSILTDTSISYKYFLYGRIISVILSIIIYLIATAVFV